MSAKDQIAAMLNELMGPRRNEESDPSGLSFRDNDVCKYFLAGFCPHEMFTNTKADLGACNLIHDESLRVAYKQSESYGKMGYERQLYNFIKKLYDDMRRKIQRNKERLELTQSDALDPASKEQLTSRIRELDQEIAKLLAEAEQHGATGAIVKSQECTEQAEKLTEEKEELKKSLIGALTRPGDTGAKPMEVCETCACFLIIGDVQQRIDEHMAGKQHVGFAKIAETIKELEDKFKKDEEERYSSSIPAVVIAVSIVVIRATTIVTGIVTAIAVDATTTIARMATARSHATDDQGPAAVTANDLVLVTASRAVATIATKNEVYPVIALVA
ncbi:Protein C50D2.8 [Aphelenchoides avenae]|nr:Protein C50D2.8 [Aphelenchus avenae]